MSSQSAHLQHIHSSGDGVAAANAGKSLKNIESPNTETDRRTTK